MIAVTIQSQVLSDLLKSAKEIGQEEDVAMVGARAAANLTRDHLFALDQTRPNAFDAPRTHFYSDAAKSVIDPVPDLGGASFTITKVGLAQRWLGGTIRPVDKKMLAIPAIPEAYGKTPREFNNLEFVPRGPGKGMLVNRLHSTSTNVEPKTRGKGYKATSVNLGSVVVFWLVSEVTQKPDPTVMPTNDDLTEAARDSMDSFLTRAFGGH